jgi:hypothetical protein
MSFDSKNHVLIRTGLHRKGRPWDIFTWYGLGGTPKQHIPFQEFGGISHAVAAGSPRLTGHLQTLRNIMVDDMQPSKDVNYEVGSRLIHVGKAPTRSQDRLISLPSIMPVVVVPVVS